MSTRTNTNFVYDPIRSGYDANSWRTISGAPAVASSGRLLIDNGVGIDSSAIHYADFCKGDVSFNINVPAAPAAGDSRYFGVAALNSSAYIRFFVGTSLYCQTSDGSTTTTSSALTWDDTNWTGANIVFRIRWEAGTAKFFIQGAQVYAVTDDSVPYGPLSLYLFDDSTLPMTVGDINVRGAQSLVMTPKTSDTNPTNPSGSLSVSQNVTVTESISLLQTSLSIPYVSGGMSESVTITEGVTILVPNLPDALSESVTISENVTVKVSFLLIPSVYEEVTITENITKGIFG